MRALLGLIIKLTFLVSQVAALLLYALPDIRRIGRQTITVKARCVGNVLEDDGFAGRLVFEHEGQQHEVRTFFLSAKPMTESNTVMLTFPTGRPQDARPNEPGKRLFAYVVILAIIGITARWILWGN